jgi:hypothetical protein
VRRDVSSGEARVICLRWRGSTSAVLDEVGGEAFVGAIERVSEGTLDREIQDEREEFGPAGAARRFFELVRKLQYDLAW